MYQETITILAGESRNVGEFVPEGVTHVSATIVSGVAQLNGMRSNKIAWVIPNKNVIIVAITDCVVEISDAQPVASTHSPLSFVAQSAKVDEHTITIADLLKRVEALEKK